MIVLKLTLNNIGKSSYHSLIRKHNKPIFMCICASCSACNAWCIILGTYIFKLCYCMLFIPLIVYAKNMRCRIFEWKKLIWQYVTSPKQNPAFWLKTDHNLLTWTLMEDAPYPIDIRNTIIQWHLMSFVFWGSYYIQVFEALFIDSKNTSVIILTGPFSGAFCEWSILTAIWLMQAQVKTQTKWLSLGKNV